MNHIFHFDVKSMCCVVLELADYTLDQFIRHRDYVEDPLTLDEVYSIALQLTQQIAMLHAKDLVH